jgi:hypothetical protein
LKELSCCYHGNHQWQIIVSHKNHVSPSIYGKWTAFSVATFLSKWYDSWTCVILLLSICLGFNHEETI